MIKIQKELENGIRIFRLSNENLTVDITNYGGHIISILAPDKNGKLEDVVLGFDDIDTYKTQDKYIGALVGRVANRIKGGRFTLNGKEYQVPVNNGPNSLHGGIHGFNTKTMDYDIKEDALVLSYHSKDGEEGYPGNLDLTTTYTLKDHTLSIRYHAVSDQDTLVNLTNHSYFNLSGIKENIYNHLLKIDADVFACVDQDGLTTGIMKEVQNTPFDFRKPTRIGDRIDQKDEQLLLGNGFDHPFIFTTKQDQMELIDPSSGRKLTISTTLPCVQIYTANFLDGSLKGKKNIYYQKRDAICMETQFLPDSIHIEKQPKAILKKGDVYDESTSYTFEVIKS